MNDFPFSITHRPFAIEPITGVMLPDGIFDSSLRRLDIGFYLVNLTKFPLKHLWVRANHQAPTEWSYDGDTYTHFLNVEPGGARFVRWKTLFSNCSPGKKTLFLDFNVNEDRGGGQLVGQDGVIERTIFASRTTQDAKGLYSCEVPEGRLSLDVVKRSYVPGWNAAVVMNDGKVNTFPVPPTGIPIESTSIVTLTPGCEDAARSERTASWASGPFRFMFKK